MPERRSKAPAPSVLILAAGEGKRMRSSTVKLLHLLGGRPVVVHVVEAVRALRCRRIVAVVGVQAAEVRAAIESGGRRRRGGAIRFCLQKRRLGTAHAVLSAERALKGARGTLLILNGDVPLVRPSTVLALLAHHRGRGAALTVLTTVLDAPEGYGRIRRGADGSLASIHEQADIGGRPDLQAIHEVNAGLYAVEMDGLFGALRATSRRNSQREYYLPDLVGVLRDAGRRVEAMLHPAAEEVLGINTRADLARAAREIFRRKAESLMEGGVTLVDPAVVWVDPEVSVAPDTILHPNVRLEGRTRIGPRCVIHEGVRIVDSSLAGGVTVLDHCLIQQSRIAEGARIGPFAHMRPGTALGPEAHIGNFVETKKAVLGPRSKANHLTYLGDTRIGRDVNVGAGTITCNYDGWNKNRTIIGDEVFIGSDTQLVAPVRVARGAVVAAGTTVTKNVPADALVLSRVPQKVIAGWAIRKRRKMRSMTKAGKARRRR